MMVYIDKEYKCYASPADGLKAVDVRFFDGMCDALIECYRFVPEGETWTREDGTVFTGEMITPHKDIAAALAIQSEYDGMEENASDFVAAYEEGVQSA